MPDDTREIATLPAVRSDSGNMLTSGAAFEHGWRVAKLFASSQLIPAHLRDKPADCFIALHMARELNENPVVVMQNIYIVSGRAGWSAQYMIGRANRSGVLRGRITWKTEGTGDAMKVTAQATLADTGETVDATASMAMAKAEGWTKNSKYNTMPEHMLRWRSATMLIRLYMPEVMMGLPTSDEIEDQRASGQMVDVTEAGRTLPAGADEFERASAGQTIDEDGVVTDTAKPADQGEAAHTPTRDEEFFARDSYEIAPESTDPKRAAWATAIMRRAREAATLDELTKLDVDNGKEMLALQKANRAMWDDIRKMIVAQRERLQGAG